MTTAGVHNPKPSSIQGPRQQAIPPWRFPNPDTSTCACGKAIRDSCFGWVHIENLEATLDDCREAKPKWGREP